MKLSRRQKIELLKAIQKGEKSIKELAGIPNFKIWEDEGRPGYFREVLSGRVVNLEGLQKEYAKEPNTPSIFWCEDVELFPAKDCQKVI